MAAKEGQRTAFNWGIVFSIVACLFLGAALFLFIDNNNLLAHGAEKLQYPEAFIMLGVLGVPFVLMLLHLIRTLWPSRTDRSGQPPSQS